LEGWGLGVGWGDETTALLKQRRGWAEQRTNCDKCMHALLAAADTEAATHQTKVKSVGERGREGEGGDRECV